MSVTQVLLQEDEQKLMKKAKMLMAAMAAIAVLTASMSAMAQQGGPGGPGGRGGRGGFGGGQRMDPMPGLAAELGLSSTQQTKIKAIMDNTRSQMRSVFGGGRGGGAQGGQGGPTPEMREKMQAAMKSEESQIEAVLTSSQKSRLAADGGIRGASAIGELRHELEKLGVNAAQKHKTNLILADMGSKFAAMRAQMMSGGGGGRNGGGGGRGGGMREAMAGYRTQIEAVLTAAQKAKFEADMPERGGGGRGGPGGPGGPGGGRGGR